MGKPQDPTPPKAGDVFNFGRYTYANNSPLVNTDPDGRNATAALGGLFVESWHLVTGRGFNGSQVWGALKDGYNGQGAGRVHAVLQDLGTASVVMGGAGALRAAGSLAAKEVVAEGMEVAAKKGLGNSFKGKSAKKIASMFERKGFKAKGPDPVNGKGGYVNPATGRSYHIDPKPQVFKKTGVERPHVDVNRPRNYKGTLEKKKYPLDGH